MRSESKHRRRDRCRREHASLNRLGVPRRKDGNRLGLRKRMLLATKTLAA